jgi:hypothetical protein
VLCLGRAVQHTGEIDLAAPVEEVLVFGAPDTAPCVMNHAVRLDAGSRGATLLGVNAAQCRAYGAVRVNDAGNSQVIIST